jgi:hypothetical protein
LSFAGPPKSRSSSQDELVKFAQVVPPLVFTQRREVVVVASVWMYSEPLGAVQDPFGEPVPA